MASQFFTSHPYSFGTRYERSSLTTVDVWVTHGSTTHARDAQRNKVNVLGTYGTHKMHQLGKNLVHEDLSDISIDILSALWHVVPTDDAYAQLAFTGECEHTGGALQLALNLSDAWFVGADFPFYKLAINNPKYTDITPTDAKNAEWLQFLANFDTILQEVGLTKTATSHSGMGDVVLYGGWTCSIDELDNLDFMDVTFRTGITCGNADAKDENKVFSIAPGHNKHKGFFVSADLVVGTSDWVSFGFHAHELFLFKRDVNIRLQSALGQNGFIKLAQAEVTRTPGNSYEFGGHGRFEYNCASLFLGYTYAHKGADSLISTDQTLYPSDVINSDTMLQGWSMHTLHIGAELDLANQNNKAHPRMSISYNRVLRARNAFLNHTVGGSAGIALTWDL